MATYLLKTNIAGDARVLIRLDGIFMARLDPEGWVPTNNIEWTGIGGSSDWDAVTADEAAAAAVELGRSREDVPES